MLDRDRERYENNRLKDWRKENRKEDREVVITAQQSTTQNRWRGLGTIFSSPITYQVLQPVKEEVIFIVAQTDVEDINGSTKFMQTSSPNVDHEYQEPTEKLNMLLLNTLKNIVNAFGTINWVTEKRWLQILRQ